MAIRYYNIKLYAYVYIYIHAFTRDSMQNAFIIYSFIIIILFFYVVYLNFRCLFFNTRVKFAYFFF